MNGLIGIKLGMTQIFNEDGSASPSTVIGVDPGTVLRVKTRESCGYDAVQVGFLEIKEKHLNKPVSGQFKKVGVSPRSCIKEFSWDQEVPPVVGSTVDLSIFEGVKKVDVIATSKGKGFSGTVKRHNFSRGPMAHGSHNHRAPGSIGAHSYPARVFPGQKLPGQYGNTRVTTRNLQVLKVDMEHNLLFLKGAVPGPKNGRIVVRKA